MSATQQEKTIRLAAVGDLLFPIDPLGRDRPRDPAEALRGVQGLLRGCDVVFGNPECTLAAEPMVPTEPRVLAEEFQIRSLRKAGLTVATLANNHTFDCYEEGFARLGRLLDETHLAWFGAGMDIEAAMTQASMSPWSTGGRSAWMASPKAASGRISEPVFTR